MINFIAGLVVGFFLGWLRLRQMAKQLNKSTEALKRLGDDLIKVEQRLGMDL